jgi:hypothetical protein
MKTDEPRPPRAAFGVAAIAMTVITLAVSVIAPATLDARSDHPGVLAAAKVIAPAAVVVAAAPIGRKQIARRAAKPDPMEVHKDWLQGGHQG